MSIAGENRLRWTYREYRLIPEDGRRHEILDGKHLVNPAPNTYHQTLSGRIQYQLFAQIDEHGLGVVFSAPTDIQLSEHDIVQPDLVVVLEQRRMIVTPIKIKGAPDLVVEILSPSTAETDRVLKKEMYRRSGVREYWIVDPDEREVEQLLLEEGSDRLTGRHSTSISCSILPGVTVDLAKVW